MNGPTPFAWHLPALLRTASCVFLAAFPSWAQAAGFWAEFIGYRSDVVYLLKQHLVIAGLSSLSSIAIGVPLGIWLSRRSMQRHAEAVRELAAALSEGVLAPRSRLLPPPPW